jgi:hypothetical protein
MIEAREPGCRTLVVTRGKRKLPQKRYLVVRTPLDMIQKLEEDRASFETVVLTGPFANNRELTAFLTDTYPALRILAGRADEEPDTYLPAYA